MIAEGTRYFIESADTRVAAFCKGAVNPRAVKGNAACLTPKKPEKINSRRII